MKNKKSFTLIELLVVIAILAGFMALLVPNYMEVRMKSRDVRRKSDLKSIQKALELYSQNQNPQAYPTALPLPCVAFTDPGMASLVYMQKMPQEPLTQCNTATTAGYYYTQPGGDINKYTLYACAENSKDPEVMICPNDFNTSTNFTCFSGKCYQLMEP